MTDTFYNSTAFSSETGKWDTDPALIADLSPLFPWDLDVCADRPNVCQNFYSEKENGLIQPWAGLCWMNPEYGTSIGQWIDKARTEGLYNPDCQAVVSLLPARTDTDWFQRNVKHASDIIFVRGRLKFGSRAHWITHLNQSIIEQAPPKKLLALIEKIGGKLCEETVQVKLAGLWPLLVQEKPNLNYGKWLTADYLKPDPAPFPSCFLVFSRYRLNLNQSEKLSSYGWRALAFA